MCHPGNRSKCRLPLTQLSLAWIQDGQRSVVGPSRAPPRINPSIGHRDLDDDTTILGLNISCDPYFIYPHEPITSDDDLPAPAGVPCRRRHCSPCFYRLQPERSSSSKSGCGIDDKSARYSHHRTRDGEPRRKEHQSLRAMPRREPRKVAAPRRRSGGEGKAGEQVGFYECRLQGLSLYVPTATDTRKDTNTQANRRHKN